MTKMMSPIWHPITQHALQDEITRVAPVDGAHLYTTDGRRIIDAISSWSVVTHGHCHPRIVNAIQSRQASSIRLFDGYPTIRPRKLRRVFEPCVSWPGLCLLCGQWLHEWK